ncbi:MAG TPA: MFS transporter [Ktedonobacterales bacterium]|nr:MFS transporter [Ktedonobacterales bacterium]
MQVFAALRHRNFRLFWFGQVISVSGTWMQSVGQAWLVLTLTHNAFLLGLVGVFQFLPVLCLSLVGGMLADKLPKRNVLMGTQSAAAVQALVMFILTATGVVRVWHVFVLAACLGTINALDIPTRQAFISEMVPQRDLMNAISLNSAQFNASRVVGPGVAGVLIAALGIPPLFCFNALSYIAVIGGLALMNPALLQRTRKLATGERPLRQIREGVAFAVRTPMIRLSLIMLFAISTFGLNFNITLPLLADTVYHSGATGFGTMSSLLGLGSLLAALALAALVKKPHAALLVLGAAVFGSYEAVLAFVPHQQQALAILAVIGFASISFSATANTMLQTHSPAHMRGRVMSLFAMVFAGATPIGALATGAIAGAWGTSAALLAGAAPCLAVAALGLAVLIRGRQTTTAAQVRPAVQGAPALELGTALPSSAGEIVPLRAHQAN